MYLDDIIVLGENFDIALENLKSVFLRLRQAHLQLKANKCKLFQKEVVFLGHLVSEFGISCDPEKIRVLKDWPRPRDKTDIKSFLGLVGYYRKMVPAFADLASPLTKLTKKKVKFQWGPEQETAFERLKDCLMQPPVLAFPLETGGQFVLDCDSSAVAIGSVISQIQNNNEKVIAYGSRTLNQAQQNYCTTKRELYSIVYFMQHFKHYLLGRRFVVRTDHAPLLWLCNFKEPSGILARWISILGAFDFDIAFRPGYLHANADAMSRKPPKRPCLYPECMECKKSEITEETVKTLSETEINVTVLPNWLNVWSHDELRELQGQNVAISEMIRLKLQSENKPLKSVIMQGQGDVITLWNQWEVLQVHDGLLYRQTENDQGAKFLQLLAPREIRDKIFFHLHEQRYAGHLGRDRTIEAIKKRFYWPGMAVDVARWCKECQVCARGKPGPGKGKSALQQFKVYRPMSVIAVDILGPLPVTNSQNMYIIVCGCYFTKWKEAFAVLNHTAAVVADKLVQEVFLRFGFPDQIHTDQGREFESDLFKSICNLLGIEKTRTCAYNAKSDGMVERFNRTLVAMLSMFVDENRSDWDDHLPYVMAAYRATQHKSTGLTPNMLMLNREIDCPLDLMVGLPPGTETIECPIKYVEWVKNATRNAFEFAYGQLKVAATRQKRYYDRGLRPREFQEGSWVWRWYPPKANLKLGLGWVGPYLVLRRLSYLTYQVQKDKDSKVLTVHVDHLKPFVGTKHPKSWLNMPQMSEQEEISENFEPSYQTPVAVRTRTGRLVKPRDIYSPE